MCSQAAPLDVESDRELDVAEALFDLANVAVSFGEQPDSDTRSAQHDSPYRHNEKIRRQQVKTDRSGLSMGAKHRLCPGFESS